MYIVDLKTKEIFKAVNILDKKICIDESISVSFDTEFFTVPISKYKQTSPIKNGLKRDRQN